MAPIIVDENMIVLAGHTRLKAIKKLGWTDVKVAIAEGLSDDQKRKYRILDNKTNEFAEWDMDALEKELEGLDFEDFDFNFGIPEDTFDETGLDDDKVKENVVVTINCKNVDDYEFIKEQLQNAADEVGATLAVKMA